MCLESEHHFIPGDPSTGPLHRERKHHGKEERRGVKEGGKREGLNGQRERDKNEGETACGLGKTCCVIQMSKGCASSHPANIPV